LAPLAVAVVQTVSRTRGYGQGPFGRASAVDRRGREAASAESLGLFRIGGAGYARIAAPALAEGSPGCPSHRATSSRACLACPIPGGCRTPRPLEWSATGTVFSGRRTRA